MSATVLSHGQEAYPRQSATYEDVTALFKTSTGIGHRVIQPPQQMVREVRRKQPRDMSVRSRQVFPGTDIQVVDHFATTQRVAQRIPHPPTDTRKQRLHGSYSVTDTYRKAPPVVERQIVQQEHMNHRTAELRNIPTDWDNIAGTFVRREPLSHETEHRSEYVPRRWTRRHVARHNSNLEGYAAELDSFNQTARRPHATVNPPVFLSTMSKNHNIQPFQRQRKEGQTYTRVEGPDTALVFRDPQPRGAKKSGIHVVEHGKSNTLLQSVKERFHERTRHINPQGPTLYLGKTDLTGVSHKRPNLTLTHRHEFDQFAPYVQQFQAVRHGGMSSHSNCTHSQKSLVATAPAGRHHLRRSVSAGPLHTAYSKSFPGHRPPPSSSHPERRYAKSQVFTYNVARQPVVKYFCGPGIASEKMRVDVSSSGLDQTGRRKLRTIDRARKPPVPQPSVVPVPNLYMSSTHRAFNDTIALSQIA